MEKIPRAFAWKMILPFSWARCHTLFLSDNLALLLETLTPTNAENESDWWKTSLEYFKGTVTTLTQTISSLQGSIGTLESQLLALEYSHSDRFKLTWTIATLESRLLALEGDERDFGVVSDGDIAAYMSPGPSYTSHGPLHTSPASTAHKSLPLANRRKLRVRRTPLKLKSPMRCYSRKSRSCTIPPPPASTTMPPVTTTKDTHLDDSDAAKDTHLDVVTTISVPMTTTELLDTSLACGEMFYYLEQGMLDGLHINAFIEVMMRKRPCNAQWTLGHSELVAFYKDISNLMSMVSVVDAVRATIDGTNPRYPSWEKISQVFFPINLDNQHWVAASWNLDDYQLFIYDSLEYPKNYEKMINLLKKWKDFIKKDLESMDWFKKTKHDPECFKILLRYVNDIPLHSSMYGTLDCGVMTCKFIEMFTKGKTINAKNFDANVAKKCQEFRAKMPLMLYDTRCERPV
ncbi:phospholipase-like protein [Tanacetum coccineum]